MQSNCSTLKLVKNKTEIPEPLFKEMLNLFGEKETQRIGESVGYNYNRLVMKVTAEKFKRKYGISFGVVSIIVIVLFSIGLFYANVFF